MRRVVITGIGLVSVLGTDKATVSEALYRGISGIVHDSERIRLGFRSGLTGRIEQFDEARFLNRKQRKSMPLFAIQAHSAVMDALAESGLAPEVLRSERCGLIFGNDSSALAAIEQWEKLCEEGSTTSLGSGHIFRGMTSTVTLNLSVLLGIRGASWTVSAACASGGYAIGQAADAIRLGRQDVMLCGGAQEITRESLAGFDGLGAFSVHSEPAAASRPFDLTRDGLVPSGGAAALVLESLDHAQARGAAILGEVRGFGYSSDGHSLSVPSRDGLARAMRGALAEAGWESGVEPVDLICAHATSTPVGDAAEAANLRAVFGERCPPVTALKSLTGHELWMAGAAQVAYAALMARNGFTAGTRNYTEPDPQCAGVPVLTHTLESPPRRVLCNAAGFGGVNACLALEF